jgi:MFS transporter, SP family, arabinose:H+ symporter
MIHAIEPSPPAAPAEDQADQGGDNLPFVVLVSLVSAMGGFLFGYETVVIAGALALVKQQFGFSAVMEGWFVSSGLMGCVVGVLAGGRLCDSAGRRSAMVISAVLLTVGALACALAPGMAWLTTGRVLGGIGVGFASIVSPLYISEVAPPAWRGRMVALFQLTITVGIVAAMLVNAGLLDHALAARSDGGTFDWLFVDEVWRGMFACQAIPAVLFLASCALVPESPRWLVLAGRSDAARAVLARLRGGDAAAVRELGQIVAAVALESGGAAMRLGGVLARPLALGVFLAVFSELSGITVVMYYGPTILERAGIAAGSSLGGHAVIGVVLACFTVVSLFVVDRFGRRRVLLTGCAGAGAALAVTGACFAVGRTEGVLVIALLSVFVAFFAFSLGPIKWIVISEIFPTTVRARAMGVATVAVWLTDIAINQAFPVVRDAFGVSAMFLGCAVFLAIQFVVALVALPETRGVALENVLSLWSGESRDRSVS